MKTIPSADRTAVPGGGPAAGRWHDLADLVLWAAEHHPGAGVRYATGTRRSDAVEQTYPALLDEARRILGGLRSHGLRPGQRVTVVGERPRDFVPALWACLLGGLVPCLLSPPRGDQAAKGEQLAGVNALIDGAAVLTTAARRAELASAAVPPVLALEELAAGARDTFVHRARPDDLALLMLTSGSTGSSKAVMLTHANLLASMTAKAERLGVTADDTTMNWVSFDHIAAVEGHLLPLVAGADQVQVDPQLVVGAPLAFLQLVDAHAVTVTFTPNFLFGQINKVMVAQQPEVSLDLSSLRVVISGGEAIVRATATAFLDQLDVFGLDRRAIVPAFGMTETCAGCVFSTEFPEAETDSEFASLGRPVRGLEMRIVDENGRPVGDGEVGELQLRGPMVFAGYLNNEAATAEAFTDDGWFRTGDRGCVDGGRLTLAGRSKDSIIVNGVSYYSHDLETVLERLDGVARSYVAAFPTRPAGSDTEQLVVAFVPTVAFEDEAAIHRLLVAIRNSTVLHWGFRPALVLPLPKEEVPKTSLGKIQRSRLRRRLESGELADVQRWVADLTTRQLGGYVAPEGDTEVALAQVYADMFDLAAGSVSATANFFELGGTSLDILQLKHRVQQRFGVADLPVITLLTAPTVRELAARIDRGGRFAADEYDPLVPLQLTGDKTPLFCVHPGVGEVLVFVNLAKYFVNERPFYALRARGFGEKEEYFGSFDEMVGCYVDAIQARQPHGPYAIAGYSYGGAVAFEIAKALEARGERVDFVGIFNLPPHIQDRMHELDFTEGAVNLAFFLALVTKEQAAELVPAMRGMGRDEQLEHLWSKVDEARRAELDIDLDKFASWVDLAQSLVMLGREYEPSGTVESLSVFYAIPLRGSKEEWLNAHLRRWDDFSRTPNRYIDVPGEHYTLMGPDHVATFQAILRAELDRALGGR